MKDRLPVWAAVWLLVFGFLGCKSSQNSALNDSKVALEHRRKNVTRAATRPAVANPDADGAFVGVAISGGGSRSANFSAAMLFELQRAGILQKVDYISSVSGGSLTAAYYCTHEKEWNPETTQKKLTHSFADDVLLQLLLPWNQFAVWFTDTDRTDFLARSLENHLFSKKGRGMTFADLLPDRPRLLINATDLQSGERFVFSNETFDELNADLSTYPLAYAVAASSSVPVVLHPVTLRDYSTVFPQYRHLIDGGITDNLGVRTLVDVYRHHIWLAEQAGRPDPYPKGAVLIVVDARTKFDSRISARSDIGVIESLKSGTGLTSSVLLERAGAATMSDIIVDNADDKVLAADVRNMIKTTAQSGYLKITDKYKHDVRVVHLSLARAVELQKVPFASFWTSLNRIATYFNIEEDDAYALYQAAELLVREKYQGHLTEIAELLNVRSPSADGPTTVDVQPTQPGDDKAR